MRKTAFILLCSILMTFGCTSMTLENVKDAPVITHKIYNVIFENKPEILKKEVHARGFEIGKVLSETLGAGDIVVVKISVLNEYDHLIKHNTVFYVSDGWLEYDTVGEHGETVSEGAKLLGFTGKTALYWFKTKHKMKDLSDEAKKKIEELY
ncbi:MAG: hypothetical protein B6245_18080 [Desulfobacteraceae bacterium 4572_88]|nr:MAG: hypothetical protein B6245_18080 [Desulfobacteraceae bacterium 4572_88]RLB99708.1 MAG: hypothetical protein DRI57_33245 [Deltaproteobacteria bacterium]